MATHSSILAWRILWAEEPGRLWFMGLQSWTGLKCLKCHACLKLRADPTAKELRINTEEAGGLEQRETEKHEPEPENKAKKMQQDRHEGQLALLLHEEVFHTFRCQGNC